MLSHTRGINSKKCKQTAYVHLQSIINLTDIKLSFVNTHSYIKLYIYALRQIEQKYRYNIKGNRRHNKNKNKKKTTMNNIYNTTVVENIIVHSCLRLAMAVENNTVTSPLFTR